MSDTLRLEHDIRAPGHARRWMIQRCHEWHCDDLADPAALLITELVTNVFLHARTDCLVHAEFDHSVLAVTVTDWDAHGSVDPPGEQHRGEWARARHPRRDRRRLGDQKADGATHADGAKNVWFHLEAELRSRP